jgi:adenylosuccinate synthase
MNKAFDDNGVHVLVDGQFGSTGKGAFASYLARKAYDEGVRFAGTISNAGPNSGHTFYHDGVKHVLKQLPTFAVKTALLTGETQNAILSAGAIVDPVILHAEAIKYPGVHICVHPNAAVIDDAAKIAETGGSIAAVAGTRSGTGAALARKVFREPEAVWGKIGHRRYNMPPNVFTGDFSAQDYDAERFFMEVSQGFSLGLNSRFYPKVTSRECTVMQGISDARVAPRFVRRTYMVIRSYPIRVGNVDGYSSGDHYPDQEETDWHTIGVPEERTTVTNRVRRVFTFSALQFAEALQANQPDVVYVNFMNYVRNAPAFMKMIDATIGTHLSYRPAVLYGWGPHDNDVSPF